jgi:hypothetical protein
VNQEATNVEKKPMQNSFRLLFGLIVFAVFVLVTYFPSSGAKCQGPAATISFADNPGDRITSDGLGVYTSASFNLCSNDLILNLSFSPRYVELDFSAPFIGYSNLGVFRGTHFVVGSVYNMSPGEEGLRVAHMSAETINGLESGVRFGSLPRENNIFQSTLLYVKRETANSWLVSTRIGEADPFCPSGPCEEFGDKAALAQTLGHGKNAVTQRSYYHMPFQFTATLP